MVVPRTPEDARGLHVLKHATVQIIVAGKNVHYLYQMKTAYMVMMQHGSGITDGGLPNT